MECIELCFAVYINAFPYSTRFFRNTCSLNARHFSLLCSPVSLFTPYTSTTSLQLQFFPPKMFLVSHTILPCNNNCIILTFIGPCIANIFSEYNQQDATFLNLFISVRRSTCFRWVFRLKHVERLTEMSKLRKVASCWLYSEKNCIIVPVHKNKIHKGVELQIHFFLFSLVPLDPFNRRLDGLVDRKAPFCCRDCNTGSLSS